MIAISVGQVIASQLEHGKGVRVERVGTFTTTIKNEPIFAFQDEFLCTNRLRCPQQPSSEQLSTSMPNAALNYYAQVLHRVRGTPRHDDHHALDWATGGTDYLSGRSARLFLLLLLLLRGVPSLHLIS